MKEYLVIFAQLLCVGWLLRTLSKAKGKLEDEQLGWFDIRVGAKSEKSDKANKAAPPTSPAAKPGAGRDPRA